MKLRGLTKGDLVIRQTSGGKLDPGWEGTFVIDGELPGGAYKLQDIQGDRIPNSWNVERLMHYYP